ncbi:Ferric iron ABC transporter, iron-binding protein [hydrothermal vent metagenome]|uniref:Ferric iron ABC transporter, iron-binding protein n=1 Tax=hydrothermal vent metagenome TaxID=652676 RepID=A0A3B0U2S1_9ZZZZ
MVVEVLGLVGNPVRLFGLIVACVLVVTGPFASNAAAVQLSGPLVIVTSFPAPLFTRFRQEFEALHPKVKIFIRSKKTSAAIAFIAERPSEAADLFWASAPDAFEVLKQSGSLLPAFRSSSEGSSIGGYPLNDPDGYYKGFAISGYGLMWNRPYLIRRGLPEPTGWSDLMDPRYAGHIGITAPSRSGTTHLIVETILQTSGWERGWAALSEIGGNLATITARSFGVMDGVRAGRFGIGPVVDFFALSARALGAPVDFVYPQGTSFLPANIAIVTRAANLDAARGFVEFLLSEAGQRLLLEPEISRLPVRPSIYADAPAGYPNPFDKTLVEKGIRFDSQLSRRRYHLVNALFDALVTYRIQGLRRTWAAIHRAEAALKEADNPELQAVAVRARRLASQVPVTGLLAADGAFTSVFTRRSPGLGVSARQLELQAEWRRFFAQSQGEALALATDISDRLAAGPGR